ncbi:MAG: hypothetical protein KO202_06900 [Methanobacteriaceae archaeon]|jgi:hypothetical protein|nr:hypothetical protein [Methanobacteriaceae archaeon]
MIDKKGNIFSIELILVIFMFIFTIGIITSLTNSTSEKISSEIDKNHIEKITTESLDNLLNNPGKPSNWENLSNLNSISPGLAILNTDNKTIKNTISYDKLKHLENSYDLLITNKVFSNKIKSSIAIYPLNSEIQPSFYGDSDERTNVFPINRLVKCDYFSKYVLVNFNENHECNKNHDLNYSCGYFKIYNSYLEENDYYLLTAEKDLYYSIDNTKEFNNEFKKINNKIYLNDILTDSLKYNNSGIFFIHLKSENPEAILIAIPKDFEKNYLIYDYFRITDCKLIFKTWYSIE